MSTTFGSDDVQILEDEVAYDGYFKIRRLHLKHRLFEGGWSAPISRELFCRGDAVGVLLYDPSKDTVVLVEQFRAGAIERSHSPWLLEVVAGVVEEGEEVEDVATREAIEEADCAIHSLIPIMQCYSSPGGSSEMLTLFCGKVDSAQAGGVHGLDYENEDIKVHVIPRKQILSLLDEGKVLNAHTVIALQWLALNWQTVQEQWR